jgi:hypothetical protein
MDRGASFAVLMREIVLILVLMPSAAPLGFLVPADLEPIRAPAHVVRAVDGPTRQP